MDPHHHAHTSSLPTVQTDDLPVNNLNLTFISIHDLSPDARILYSSESIIDVLGYTPEEVVNQSIWDFFPPEEVPYAQLFHKNGLEMDKAAMLAYCRVKDSTGAWVGCECCFTIVYDVVVVCTSIYRSGLPSQKRALEAPLIRRLFTSSPRDPRYHMLSHISHKFQSPAKPESHEPRAALFLNRFTRTLTIMYATSAIQDILGIPSSELQGKSFYYCIAESCLNDAVRCLENAKGNDSIAYLRFWFRDPRRDDPSSNYPTDDSDDEMTTDASVDQDVEGGVHLGEEVSSGNERTPSTDNAVQSDQSMDVDRPSEDEPQSRTSSNDSGAPADSHTAIFGSERASESSVSSASFSPTGRPGETRDGEMIELEAVISCASDGLVVCLRRARPIIPQPTHRPSQPAYRNGLFAAPWADTPLVPQMDARPQYGYATSFAPALGPQAARAHMSPSGPDRNDFMSAIREQAIFAWALTGINGSLHRFGAGTPRGESVPADGLPVWKCDQSSHSNGSDGSNTDMVDSVSSSTVLNNPKSPAPHKQYSPTGNDHRNIFGDPGIKHVRHSSKSSIKHLADGVGGKHDSAPPVGHPEALSSDKDWLPAGAGGSLSKANDSQLPDGI